MNRWEAAASVSLWAKRVADRLADGDPGLLRWRWRLSTLFRGAHRRVFR